MAEYVGCCGQGHDGDLRQGRRWPDTSSGQRRDLSERNLWSINHKRTRRLYN
jgi:hypothetical protein